VPEACRGGPTHSRRVRNSRQEQRSCRKRTSSSLVAGRPVATRPGLPLGLLHSLPRRDVDQMMKAHRAAVLPIARSSTVMSRRAMLAQIMMAAMMTIPLSVNRRSASAPTRCRALLGLLAGRGRAGCCWRLQWRIRAGWSRARSGKAMRERAGTKQGRRRVGMQEPPRLVAPGPSYDARSTEPQRPTRWSSAAEAVRQQGLRTHEQFRSTGSWFYRVCARCGNV
jgi:hypothetical protein